MDAKATMHMENLPHETRDYETQFKKPQRLGLRIILSENLINSCYGICNFSGGRPKNI